MDNESLEKEQQEILKHKRIAGLLLGLIGFFAILLVIEIVLLIIN